MKRLFRHDRALCVRLTFTRLIVMYFFPCRDRFYRRYEMREDKGRTVRRIHVFTLLGRAFVFQNLYSSLGWMHPDGMSEPEFQSVWNRDWDWLEPGYEEEWDRLARQRKRKGTG